MQEDIHEGHDEHLAAARAVYLDLAAAEGWRVVPVMAGEAYRDPDEIAAEVWTAVSALL